MKFNLPGLALLSLALSACTSGPMSAAFKEDTLNAYGSAIRWGPFDKAVEFQNPAHRTRLDEAWLRNIHVTSYNPLYLKEEDGSKVLEQKVEIRYINDQVGVEQSLVDRQLWRYYEDREKWVLESDIPNFR